MTPRARANWACGKDADGWDYVNVSYVTGAVNVVDRGYMTR